MVQQTEKRPECVQIIFPAQLVVSHNCKLLLHNPLISCIHLLVWKCISQLRLNYTCPVVRMQCVPSFSLSFQSSVKWTGYWSSMNADNPSMPVFITFPFSETASRREGFIGSWIYAFPSSKLNMECKHAYSRCSVVKGRSKIFPMNESGRHFFFSPITGNQFCEMEIILPKGTNLFCWRDDLKGDLLKKGRCVFKDRFFKTLISQVQNSV